MNTTKKICTLLLVLFMLAYCVIGFCTNNNVQARERTEDLSNLVNYPEIYTTVQELKTAHPNWTFTALYTGLDWNTVIRNETTALHTRSLVHKSLVKSHTSEWVCATCGADPNVTWWCASDKTVSYYMDPKNWVNESYIFAFETLSFNPNAHTVEGVQAIIAGTFLDKSTITYIDTNGATQTINKSYAQIIFEAGQTYNVSPYHLAARIRQEQGSGGSSLISGNFTFTDGTPYVGYYNYFNIGATHDDDDAVVIKNGLEAAKARGWTTPELAIHGGAKFLASDYIGSYQDSLYLQKYNVDSASGGLYSWQYQQNVSAPFTESLEVYDAYEELGILESNFNFIIPIYENMPSVASEKPGIDMQLQTEDVIVTTSLVPLSIRSGPSTDYYIKAKAPKDTTIVRIEKAQEMSSDGRYWDRVAYNTGTQMIIGYASREYLTDTATIEKVNEVKTIGTMCNLRNGPSGTNTKVKQILSVGTQVTIIDKLNFSVDGHIWYRVKLADGTQGYISSAYIQKKPDELYKIEGTYMKIAPETKLTDIPGTVLNGITTGTGANVTLNGTPYTLVVLGDVNGDGNITPADYVRIKNNIMGTTLVEELYKPGADVNRDGNITPADYVRVKNHIMNVTKIYL